MMKKHLITCSGMLVLLLVGKMLVFSTPVDPIEAIKFNRNHPTEEKNNTFSFANEDVPLGDKKVNGRMEQILKAHTFGNLQTHILHHKAAKWFPVMEPILKLHGIPLDFKYIPLVESGLKSGTSHKGASGYWQFMPQTARDFGLRVDGDVDERQMVTKSTIAACKYLKSLFAEFKNWTLVAAAYNGGEGSLRRQIERQKEDNYFKMKLNAETSAYVYKLISMKEIIEKPTHYGYHDPISRLLAKNEAEKEDYTHLKPAANFNTMMALQVLHN
ncbi:MAG TPA: lytic transglycosylase domain-containing protein [Daejeonella sp.]|nr:lytic transglycosylase domain-containing protein [Daejeonella sp.]